jgi:hypothetical protein
MKLQEIQAAVLAGKTVHWKTEAYEVVCDSVGQWLIVCRSTKGCWGLTWTDNTTMNGKPEEFFVAGVTQVTLVDKMRAALEAVDRADTYVHERGAALALVRAVLKGGAL